MLALIFPGQGSQATGMGKSLSEAFPVARRTFEEADDALGAPLSRLCFEGPDSELEKTENTQPAILATSTAVFRVLRGERPDLVPSFGAGHSLGELSALVAAGVLRFPDALRLVRERGRLMQQAVPIGEGAMSAILAVPPEVVTAVCGKVEAEHAGAVVRPANFNGPEQTVISGSKAGVDLASAALSAEGAKVMPLKVSAPFHSPLMAPAARGLEAALAPLELGLYRFPIVSNVEALPGQDNTRTKALLVEQVTAPVRWVEIVRFLASRGVTRALELGPGKVLAGLVKRIDKGLEVLSAGDPASLEKALGALAK